MKTPISFSETPVAFDDDHHIEPTVEFDFAALDGDADGDGDGDGDGDADGRTYRQGRADGIRGMLFLLRARTPASLWHRYNAVFAAMLPVPGESVKQLAERQKMSLSLAHREFKRASKFKDLLDG